MIRNYFLLIIGILCANCSNQPKRNILFTAEQVASLRLDSTVILDAKIDSLITVNLNPFLKQQSYDLGSLIKEIKLVPLETTDESLLDDIYKILVTDTHIYIYDQYHGGGLIIFEKDGKFVKRLPHGQGPGELSKLHDMAYDADNGEFVAYVNSFLLFFTPDGKYLHSERLPIGFYNFIVTPDGYVFKTIDRQNNHLETLNDYSLFITDKRFKVKSAGLFFPPKGQILGGFNYLWVNNNIMVTQKFTDTIYQYVSENNRLNAKYFLDFKDKELPERYLHSNTWKEFKNAITQNDYYYFLGEYLETGSHDVFLLRNDYRQWQVIVYRHKQTGKLVGGTYGEYDGISISRPLAASGDYFIACHYPDANDSLYFNSPFLSDSDKEKLKALKEDDNPALVFFSLKDF